MTGPQKAPGSLGSFGANAAMAPLAASTASSYLSRGTTRRVVSAQPWPACVHALRAVMKHAEFRSASSSTTAADLPPSSRKTFFSVSAAAAMIFLPVAVDPVKETRSTRGSVVSCSPRPWSDDDTTLSTPAGMSVSSAAIRATAAAMSGVSGAGLSTTVQPAASAGPILAKLIWLGKFHGVMAPTTPTASRRVERLERTPMISDSPSSVTHS